jgi:hypothetical protein
VPIGLAYLFPNIPLDIFAEIGPVVHLAPETGFALTGAIGVRYFFRSPSVDSCRIAGRPQGPGDRKEKVSPHQG